MAVEKEPLPPDELRCHRNDGRSWRCKNPAITGKSHCLAHLYRPKVVENYDSTHEISDAGPGTRARFRVRAKPRVKHVDEIPVEKVTDLGDEVEGRENGGGGGDVEGMWGPRVRSADVGENGGDDVEGSENGDGGGGDSPGMRGPRMKMVAEVERRENGGGSGGDVEGMRGPRVKRAKLGSEAEEGESSKVKVRVKVKSKSKKSKAKSKLKAVMAVEEGEKKNEGEGGDEEMWRCKRTDGRGWRCKRRVSEGKTMCELHYEQARLRQRKVTVPEAMKLQKRSKLRVLEDSSDVGMRRMKAELIRVFLRREIMVLDKRNDRGCGEVTKDLPYGSMVIPRAPSARVLESVEGFGVRVGGQHSGNSLVRRRFRSKNIEPLPVGTLKVVPFAGDVRKAKNGAIRKCHWCQNRDVLSLTKCLSCKTRFFCAACIKDRDSDTMEVEIKCPVCRGSCDCETCCTTQTNDVNTKDFAPSAQDGCENPKGGCEGSEFQQLQYLIKLLLPVLERINEEQIAETEIEARFQGRDVSGVEIRQADVGCRDRCCCNNCKSPILDFHRSCPNCSYNLCLSCCREYGQIGRLNGTENTCSESHTVTKTCLPGLRLCSERILKTNSSVTDSTTPCLRVSCPPMELGGCDNSFLELRRIFPMNWTKQLEISAKEAVSGHELPQTTDDSSDCSLCANNFVFLPRSSDEVDIMVSHFQKHWRTGHPVIFRNVFLSASALSLDDPLTIFRSSLENNPNSCEIVNSEDWYEVEIGTREPFTRSSEGSKHRRYKTLRVTAKPSLAFSRRLFGDHYSQFIHALPLELCTNPFSGLLNIARNLPEDLSESNLGPHVCISFGSREVVARGELVTKLNNNSYDVVYILSHVTDLTYSAEQIDQISMLIKQNNKADQTSDGRENNVSTINADISAKLQGQNRITEQVELANGVVKSPALGTSDSVISACDKRPLKPCGAQWDVFRREDVPKLVEYIRKHAEELSYSYGFPENVGNFVTDTVVHPIIDGSFYLDSIHKMQLKEEFDIEPWTFNQCLGEAVFVPAGCPYQIENVKSCVNIACGFISPESASECIKLINETRILSHKHKAKEMSLEVVKMTILSIDEALKQINRLSNEESSLLDQIPKSNSC